jgi:T-complex protein 1 subunit eta
VALATGAKLQTTTRALPVSCLGFCGLFEERQVGGERFNVLSDCVEAKSATIVVRGGSEQFVEEAHRRLVLLLVILNVLCGGCLRRFGWGGYR